MTRPTVRIHDLESDEIIDREMNDNEFAEYQARESEKQAEKVEAEAKEKAKANLLAKLGISEEEAKLLLS